MSMNLFTYVLRIYKMINVKDSLDKVANEIVAM